ncbi:hypothetical protein, partial [Novosphingobium hassiacum]|uniref:hypothetical protein n=1 Tax=Novosphingobium hassiacum TaxID=173676 RepID=UPI001C85AACF
QPHGCLSPRSSSSPAASQGHEFTKDNFESGSDTTEKAFEFSITHSPYQGLNQQAMLASYVQ